MGGLIEKLIQLEKEATPAPWREGTLNVWELRQTGPELTVASTEEMHRIGRMSRDQAQADCALIAEMRNSLPKFLALYDAAKSAAFDQRIWINDEGTLAALRDVLKSLE